MRTYPVVNFLNVDMIDQYSYRFGMKTRVSERGQITIPKAVRDRLGIRPGQVLEVREQDGTVVAFKAATVDHDGRHGDRWLWTSDKMNRVAAQFPEYCRPKAAPSPPPPDSIS